MNRRQTPLEVVVEGAIAGVAGGAVITFLMGQARQMMGRGEPSRPAPRREEPREKLVRKVSSTVFEAELPEEERKTWAQTVHWAYAAFWGALYGVIQASLNLPPRLHGGLLGTLVWAFGPLFMLPKMRLSPPPQQQPPVQLGMGWVMHLAYGLTTAFTFELLSRVRPLRAPQRRQTLLSLGAVLFLLGRLAATRQREEVGARR